jgi:hypothetical protein
MAVNMKASSCARSIPVLNCTLPNRWCVALIVVLEIAA